MLQPLRTEPREALFANGRGVPRAELGIAALFFLLAAAEILAGRRLHVTLLWPSDAVAAALLIRLPQLRWWSAGLALTAAGVAANFVAVHAWGFALALTGVHLGEIALMVWTYRVAFRFPYPHISIDQAAHMTLLYGLAIPAGAAAAGGWVVHAALGAPWRTIFDQWWVTDAVGACLFGPPLILCSRKGWQRLVQRRFLPQNVGTLLLCMLACYGAIRYVKFPFVVFGVPLLAAAFRLGGFGAALLSLCSGLTVLGLWLLGVRPSGLEVQAAHHAGSISGLPLFALLASLLPSVAVGLGTDARRAALRSLRFSERRFRESLAHSPVGIILSDLQGVWTYTNVALQRMLGYGQDELRNVPVAFLSHPEDVPDIDRRWRQLRAQEIDFYEVDRRFLHKDGAWVWVHAAVSLVRDEEGEPQHFIAQIVSLEARRRAEEKLANERERLKTTLLAIGDAVITTDADTRITYLNAAAQALLGQELGDIEGRRWDEVVSLTDPLTSANAANMVGQSIVHGTVFRREAACVLMRPDGVPCYVTDVVSPVVDATGRVTSVVIVLHDASREFERVRDVTHRASHDAMTGLANRFEFQRRAREVFQFSRHVGVPAAVLAIDLDRFKAVNDAGGHAAGDAVLRRVAEVLRTTVRHSDTIARLGGDEFAIILENCSLERTRAVAQQMLRVLNPLVATLGPSTYEIGASIGIAMMAPEFEDEADWLAEADRACYEAKRGGRGQAQLTDTGRLSVLAVGAKRG